MQIKYKQLSKSYIHFPSHLGEGLGVRFLLLLLSVWTTVGWAQTAPQTNYTLQGNENGAPKSYVARDYVSLKPGFTYSASGTNTFSAKIDAGLLFPPTSNTYADANGEIVQNASQGFVVGSIPGSVSVSPTGAASYQIPIEVPTGINGMQPQVSIAYNSQGGFGTLGQSWELSAVSAITRGGKSIYYDNTNVPVSLESDALYIDGQRLIWISGTPFTNNATYATEVENYSKVVFTNWGFILTTVDGKTMEYGVTTNSRLMSAAGGGKILGWKLNKVTDTYGNSISYTYSSSGQYLSSINYAGQSVEFAYNYTLQVAKKSYISDFLISHTKLLTAITTKSGTTVLNTVGFTYKSTSDNRLDIVSTTARDNSKVNETVINWGTDNSTIQKVNVGDNPDKNLAQNGGSVYSADVNGDGYADRIELWPGSNCDSEGNKGHVLVRLFNSANKQFNSSVAGCYYFCPYDDLKPTLTTGDINNDGKDEIVLYKKDWLVVLGLSNNTLCEILPGVNFNLENNHQGYNEDRKYEIFTTNVNNDNYPDVVMVFGYHFDGFMGWNDKRAGYAVFTGSATGLTKVYDVTYNDDNAFEDFRIADFDADGKMDVVGKVAYNRISHFPEADASYDNNYINFYTEFISFPPENLSDPTGYRYTLDYNGDGLPETLMQVGYNGGVNSFVWSFKNKSNNLYLVANPANSLGNPEEKYQMYPIDYNGDGLVDFIQGDEVTLANNSIVTNWHFYKNLGDLNFQWEKTTQLNCRLNEKTAFVSDINGDGIADLVFPSSTIHTYTETICPEGGGGGLQTPQLVTGVSEPVVNSIAPPIDECYDVTSSYTTYEYSAFTMPNATRRNTVTSITNGMGQTNSFTYKNFSAYDQTATTGVVRNLKAPILVVDTQTEPDESTTAYTFEKPKVHVEGKGFLGFSTVTAVNTTKNAKMVSNYEIEPTYYGVNLKDQTVSTANDLVISKSKQYNGVRVIDPSKKRFIPIVTAQWNFDKLKEVVQTTKINYDSYPTITQTAEVKDSATNIIDLTTKVVNTFTGPGGCLFPYLPATVTTTRTQNGGSDTIVIAHTYEYNGFKVIKSTETTDSDKPQYAVSTEYSNPDAWGHMRNIAVKAKDQTGAEITRGSSVIYTTSGRFIASKTNALSETTTYDWGDGILGQLKSETTTIGGKARTTTYSYNSRGDLVETRYPDGNRKTAVVQWAGTGGVSGAKYYTYSEASGSAPVTVWYDVLGREIQKDTYGLSGKKISVTTEYNTFGVNKGKVNRVSEPYFEGDTKAWATYAYHPAYGYVSSVTTPIGTTTSVYDKLKATVTSPEGTSETVTNAAGQTMSSTVNSKKVNFAYYPSGLTKTSTPDGGLPITMTYNLQGKRTLLVDPDGGTVRTEYNGWGELTKQVQLIHMNKDSIETTNNYDAFGRLLTINRNNEMTTYTYDTNNKSRVNSISIPNKNTQTFEFDALDRVTKVTEDITANGTTKTFISGKDYDALGRLKKETYPSGYYTVNTYDQYSNLKEVRDEVGSGRSIWKANTENALGQATSIFKGAKETKYVYDPINHLKTSIKANGVIDYTYGYDSKNNLSWRKDNLDPDNIQQEDFGYDPQNRLTNWDVTRNGTTTYNSMSFDANGNINQKSDLGAFTMYYGGKNPNGTTTGRPDPPINSAIGPHALSAIGGVPASPFPQTDLTVTYTDFKKIATLHEGIKDYELTYGVDDQRRMSVYYANGKSQGAPTLTRYYVGDYEEEIVGTNIRKIHYLSGAILIQNNGVDSLLYTYSDAQGSLIALTNANGNILTKTVNGVTTEIGRFAYDPWGARRNPTNWNEKDSRTSWVINRGYTGHEHIDAFGIINMNGRVYDPYTAMFFSPDPYVQAPGDWLNYNRYGYCFGNPFKYTDPSGEFIFTVLAAIFCPPLIPLGILMDVSGAINLANSWQDISNNNFGAGLVKGIGLYAVGGVQATSTYYLGPIGSLIGSYGGEYLNSLILTGKTDRFKDNLGTITQQAGLAFMFAPFGSGVSNAITKGIGNEVLKSVLNNVIANNFTSLFVNLSASLWTGGSFKEGFENYLGVGKPWYQMPWLQTSIQAGVQTNMEFNDARTMRVNQLSDDYNLKRNVNYNDFIAKNSFFTNWSMRFELQQNIWISNIYHPNNYNLNNPIYIPNSILPSPAIRITNTRR
ncbi:MAG: hypothetical protein GZ091_12450 [Paludibacter sp.]|nr:hypothetical protein [Paludibacter sp.]